jgi:DNA-binding Xre family transcriptional regulator
MDYTYENFKAYWPFLAREAESYVHIDSFLIHVKLTNGEVYAYDDLDTTIRRLPQNSNELTKSQYEYEFGDRLRRVMRMKGVTQQELSEKTGISRPLLNSYINRKKSPSFYNVDKIAKALNCSTDLFRYSE